MSCIVMFKVEFLKLFDCFAKILSDATFWVFSITIGNAFKIGGSNGLLAKKKKEISSIKIFSLTFAAKCLVLT